MKVTFINLNYDLSLIEVSNCCIWTLETSSWFRILTISKSIFNVLIQFKGFSNWLPIWQSPMLVLGEKIFHVWSQIVKLLSHLLLSAKSFQDARLVQFILERNQGRHSNVIWQDQVPIQRPQQLTSLLSRWYYWQSSNA